MAENSEYYRSRAAECERDADQAVLDNVRERCLRSAAAWLSMADRVSRGETMRQDIAAEKAARPTMPAEADGVAL
jgi:hypothetical protein